MLKALWTCQVIPTHTSPSISLHTSDLINAFTLGNCWDSVAFFFCPISGVNSVHQICRLHGWRGREKLCVMAMKTGSWRSDCCFPEYLQSVWVPCGWFKKYFPLAESIAKIIHTHFTEREENSQKGQTQYVLFNGRCINVTAQGNCSRF